MKKIVVLLFLLLLSSCEKSNFCSEIIKGKPDNHLINDSDLQTVKSLFESNNLSLNNFLVYRLQIDDMGYKHVKCYQYVNNLKVFTDEVIFHFDAQNHYYVLSGELISTINIKTSPSMSKNDVIKIFLKSVEDDDSDFSPNLEQLKDGCFLCELGYYDLNSGTSYASQNFIRAWKITPEDKDFPVAFINDSDKSLIYYFNGVIID